MSDATNPTIDLTYAQLGLILGHAAASAYQRGQAATYGSRLDQLSAQHTSDTATILQEIRNVSASLNTELTQLQADVAAQTTLIGSTTSLIQGLTAQLAAAEQAAKDAGATDAQIAGFAAARQALEANTAALAAAIPANTPAAASGGTTAAAGADTTGGAAAGTTTTSTAL